MLRCAGSTHFCDADGGQEALRAVVSLDAVGWKRGTAVLHAMPYQDRFGARSIVPDWLVTRASNAARKRGSSLPIGDPWLGLVYQVVVRTVDVGDYSDDRPFLAQGCPPCSSRILVDAILSLSAQTDTIEQIGRKQWATSVERRSGADDMDDGRSAAARRPTW